jgi:hypothetical protein
MHRWGISTILELELLDVLKIILLLVKRKNTHGNTIILYIQLATTNSLWKLFSWCWTAGPIELK